MDKIEYIRQRNETGEIVRNDRVDIGPKPSPFSSSLITAVNYNYICLATESPWYANMITFSMVFHGVHLFPNSQLVNINSSKNGSL